MCVKIDLQEIINTKTFKKYVSTNGSSYISKTDLELLLSKRLKLLYKANNCVKLNLYPLVFLAREVVFYSPL